MLQERLGEVLVQANCIKVFFKLKKYFRTCKCLVLHGMVYSLNKWRGEVAINSSYFDYTDIVKIGRFVTSNFKSKKNSKNYKFNSGVSVSHWNATKSEPSSIPV